MTALTDAAPTRVYKSHAKPAWRRVLLTREAAIIAILLLVTVVALATVRNFDSPLTVTYLLRDIAPILLIALPMTLIIITEEIDLSVASIVGLSSVITGVLTQGGVPFPLAALAAVIVGVVAGVLLIGTLGSALRLASVSSDIINVITGLLLIVSVVSSSLLAWLQVRRAAAIGKRKGRSAASADPS